MIVSKNIFNISSYFSCEYPDKYEEILNIFLETIKDENYKNVISKDEIIIKALVSATMQIRKKDEKLSDKYLKELEKLKIFKVVKVD